MQKSICYLICVFNDQQGLEKTLASIFDDDPLADILVVDDGSNPAVTLPQVPAGYKAILLPLPKNMGLIAALNEGLKHIINKEYAYIARVDAGDTVNKGRLQKQLDYMEANTNTGLLGTQLRAFETKTDKTLFHINNPIGAVKTSHTLKMKNCIAHPSVMIRSDAFKKVGFYDPNFKHAEDYEMWRRIDTCFAVDNVADILVNKEITPHQITAVNRRGSALSRLKAQIKYFKFFDLWCWLGVIRSMISLVIPRKLLLFVRSRLSMAS